MSQQNKSTLQSNINSQLADNTSGDISAADVRDNLINMTDSLLFNSGSQTFTGGLTATSFTGSLQGTATSAVSSSFATSALSASYSLSASYEINYETSSSYAENASTAETAQTASYVLNAVSASWAPSTGNTLPSSVLVAVDGVGSDFYSGSGFIIVKEYLIPANTLTTSSVLEVSSAFAKNIGAGNVNVYMNLSSSLYVNSLAYAFISSTQPYSAFYRSFAISGSQIISLNPNQAITTDVVASPHLLVSSSIDTTIDNYLLLVLNPAQTTAETRVLHNRIIAHK